MSMTKRMYKDYVYQVTQQMGSNGVQNVHNLPAQKRCARVGVVCTFTMLGQIVLSPNGAQIVPCPQRCELEPTPSPAQSSIRVLDRAQPDTREKRSWVQLQNMITEAWLKTPDSQSKAKGTQGCNQVLNQKSWQKHKGPKDDVEDYSLEETEAQGWLN
eukprot:1102424-Pelagomonas_calceolata.AAC.1